MMVNSLNIYKVKARIASINAKFIKIYIYLLKASSFPYPDNEFLIVWTTRDKPAIDAMFGDANSLDWIRLKSLYWVGE